MRYFVSLLALLAVVTTLDLGHAEAQESGFGLGVIVGDPTGLSLKGYAGDLAIDGAVGFGLIGGNHLAAHVDVLWQPQLASLNRANMLLHFGVGPKFAIWDGGDNDGFALGARVPVGLTFAFTRAPVDVFIEASAGLWIISNVDFDLDAAVGARYWF